MPFQDQYKGLRKVLQNALICLKMFARDNNEVKDRLMNRLDLLLDVKGAESELAIALTEVS